MADLTITPANVKSSSTGRRVTGEAGAAITAGQCLYKDTTDGLMKLCDANAAAPANKFAGIALNTAALGHPVVYVTKDSNFKVGATMAVGDILIVSGTPGGIGPVADKATGWFPTYLGEAIDTTHIDLDPKAGSVASA